MNVMPAEAGIQILQTRMDSRFRGNDEVWLPVIPTQYIPRPTLGQPKSRLTALRRRCSLPGVAPAVGEAVRSGPAGTGLGLGLRLGDPGVDARAARVVHGHLGIDRLIAEPAAPPVGLADLVEAAGAGHLPDRTGRSTSGRRLAHPRRAARSCSAMARPMRKNPARTLGRPRRAPATSAP